MTEGLWVCPKCGQEEPCYISEFVQFCSKCDAEFELVEHLEGAHIFHTVPIWKVKGEDIEYSNQPIAFAGGRSEEALRRYFQVLSNYRSLQGSAKDV